MREDASPWRRIDEWLAKHTPEVLALLRPPASAESMQRLAAAAGRALPAGLVAAYAAHDGATGEHPAILGAVRAPRDAQWARYMWWLSVDDALARLRFMEGLDIWPKELLPFAEDAGGNVLVVDLESGSVLAWDHETADTTPLALDFEAWMRALADDMDASLVVGPSDEDEEDDRLTLLNAPPPPPAPPPAVVPDRDARVLIAVMCDGRYLELSPNVDLEPLIAALHAALSLKSARARKAKVIDVLEKSDAIEEIFADDEKIGLLIDEVV